MTDDKMGRWKKDAKEFPASVTLNGHRGYQMVVPKPLMEFLGGPPGLIFRIRGKRVSVEADTGGKRKRRVPPGGASS